MNRADQGNRTLRPCARTVRLQFVCQRRRRPQRHLGNFPDLADGTPAPPGIDRMRAVGAGCRAGCPHGLAFATRTGAVRPVGCERRRCDEGARGAYLRPSPSRGRTMNAGEGRRVSTSGSCRDILPHADDLPGPATTMRRMKPGERGALTARFLCLLVTVHTAREKSGGASQVALSNPGVPRPHPGTTWTRPGVVLVPLARGAPGAPLDTVEPHRLGLVKTPGRLGQWTSPTDHARASRMR